MSFPLNQERSLSAEEYLTKERNAPQRNEWNHGTIIAMAGASQDHIDIVDNVIFAIRQRLTNKACRTAAHDLRVKTETSYVYPDVVVTCGERAYTDSDCLTNPLIIVEVLSPSTEKADRGWKLTAYRSIATVQEIVYIHQDQTIVERYHRLDSERWLHDIYIHLDQALLLESLQISIPVREIYENLI